MAERAYRLGRRIGALLQGGVLGVFLFLALAKLIETASDARIFRYQGF
jgi:hypothetical protein